MKTNNLLITTDTDHFHQSHFFDMGWRKKHIFKIRFVYLGLLNPKSRNCLFLTQTNRTNRRMTENHGRNQTVVQMTPLHAAVQAISKAPPGGDRDGC